METDVQRVVDSLKACATGSPEACRKGCPYYPNGCDQLLADAAALLAAGYDLKEGKPHGTYNE